MRADICPTETFWTLFEAVIWSPSSVEPTVLLESPHLYFQPVVSEPEDLLEEKKSEIWQIYEYSASRIGWGQTLDSLVFWSKATRSRALDILDILLSEPSGKDSIRVQNLREIWCAHDLLAVPLWRERIPSIQALEVLGREWFLDELQGVTKLIHTTLSYSGLRFGSLGPSQDLMLDNVIPAALGRKLQEVVLAYEFDKAKIDPAFWSPKLAPEAYKIANIIELLSDTNRTGASTVDLDHLKLYSNDEMGIFRVDFGRPLTCCGSLVYLLVTKNETYYFQQYDYC